MRTIKLSVILMFAIIICNPNIVASEISNTGFGKFYLGQKRSGGTKTALGYLETKSVTATIRGKQCLSSVKLMSTLDDHKLYRIVADIHNGGRPSGCNVTNDAIALAIMEKYGPNFSGGDYDSGLFVYRWDKGDRIIEFIEKRSFDVQLGPYSPITLIYFDGHYRAEDRKWREIETEKS